MAGILRTNSDTNAEKNLERRTFLSAVLSGAAIMLVPNVAAAADLEGKVIASECQGISPSPADSLTFYMNILDKVTCEACEPARENYLNVNSALRKSVEKLTELTKELEAIDKKYDTTSLENSELKKCLEKLNNLVTKKGSMQNGAFLPVRYVEAISDSSNDLKRAAIELDKKEIILSPKAVKIRKEILQEIRNHDTLSAEFASATKTLNVNYRKIASEVDSVKDKLTEAIHILAQENDQKQAEALIEKASKELKEFQSQNVSSRDLLVGLLENSVSWIKEGGQVRLVVPEKKRPNRTVEYQRKNGKVEFITVSANRTTDDPGLFSEVEKILKKDLPDPITSRIWICIALVAPILVAEKNTAERIKKIKEVIPYLPVPTRGKYEKNEDKAVNKLANLQIET